MIRAIAHERLRNQCLVHSVFTSPAELVAWFGAVQAQEYPSAKWALGLRLTAGTTDADVERAFNDGRILRTHVMRPTWHFVAAEDIHWMLDLTAPRVHAALAYACRQFELDVRARTRGAGLIERVLGDGEHLTRVELGARLARAGLKISGVRLSLLTIYAELERVMCSGVQRGRQCTYSLLERRVPQRRQLPRDEAVAELTRRYFQSHGPATLRDFAWWSGLPMADAKRGVEMIRAACYDANGHAYWIVEGEGRVRRLRSAMHLLPIYDEYFVAYRDWDAVPRAKGPRSTLDPTLIGDGQAIAVWRATTSPRARAVQVSLLEHLTSRQERQLEKAVANYGAFLTIPVTLSVSGPGRKAKTRRG